MKNEIKNIIELKNCSLNLGNFSLSEINLNVAEKEIFAILGKTGSGKTLLLELIAGLYENFTGEIFINKQNILELPLQDSNIGFVYQDYGLFPHLTVHDNIAYGLKMHKVAKDICEKTVLEIANILGIKRILKQYPGTISGGEKQRTALARILVLKPKIILMDEPFSALDPVTKDLMYDHIKNIHKIFGCTIIFVTHDFQEATNLAHSVGIMVDGELRATRKSSKLFLPYDDDEINNFLHITQKKFNTL